jgi:hypothetical protein
LNRNPGITPFAIGLTIIALLWYSAIWTPNVLPIVFAATGGTYSTNFSLTQNPISEGGNWMGGSTAGGGLFGDVQTTPGFAFGVNEPTTFGDPTAILTGTWGPNQTVQGTVKIVSTPTGSCCHEIELRLRMTISANRITGYEAYCSAMPDNPYCHIARWNGPNGSYCNLDNITPRINVVNGDVMKATVTGSSTTIITLFINGTQILQATDTGQNCSPGGAGGPFTSGNPGLGFYDNVDNNWNGFGFSSFTAVTQAATAATEIGIYRSGQWQLDSNGTGSFESGVDKSFALGFPGAVQFVGDWNGDGRSKAGVYSNGYWFLDYDGNGVWDGGVNDKLVAWGWAGVTPIIGDWNGDGKTKIGVYSNGFWFLDYNGDYLWDGGIVDKQVGWGWVGTMPIVGDWNGDGKTKIGVYSNGFWFLDYDGNYVWDGGVVDKQVGWGWAGVTPIVGDWNGDGKTKIGVYSGGYWYLDYDGNYLWEYPAHDQVWALGWAGTTPVMGDWNGDGRTKAGAFFNGFWYLDYNGNGVFDGSGTDRIYAFGFAGDTPVVGHW